MILGAMSKKSYGKVMKRPGMKSDDDAEMPQKLSKTILESSSKPPSWCNECSRWQIQFRTGLPGPGQNTAINYDSPKTEKMAITKAKKLLAAEKVRRGLA